MITDDEIIFAATSSSSMREAADKTNVSYLTFRKAAKRLGIWKPKQGLKGQKKIYGGRHSLSLGEILTGKYYAYGGRLKYRLIQAGIKRNACEECGLNDTWNGKPITCELDHVNGDSRDHRLLNLRMLCPNCHSQTPTFRAKNKHRGAHD